MRAGIAWLLVLGCSQIFAAAQPDPGAAAQAYVVQQYPASYFRHWQPLTALDMLLRVPAISLQQNTDGRIQVQLHGMDSSYLAILLDGQPLAGNGQNNNRDLAQIPASLVQRVEIYPNGIADLDSRGGAAGTINLVLLQPQQHTATARISLGGEPLNSAINLAGSQPLAGGKVTLLADFQKRRQQLKGEDEQQAGLVPLTIGDRWKSHNAENSAGYYLAYNRPVGEQQQFSSSLIYLQDDQQQRNDNRDSNNPLAAIRSQQQRYDTLRLKARVSGTLGHRRWQSYLLTEQFKQRETLQTGRLQHQARRWQLQASLNEQQDEHHWHSGISLRRMERDVSSLLSGSLTSLQSLDFHVSENSLNWYLLDRWDLTSNTWFEAGFRMETYELRQTDEQGNKITAVTGDTFWLPSFHLKYRYDDELHLSVSGSQSARQPELSRRIPYAIRQGEVELRGNGNLNAELVSALNGHIKYRSRHLHGQYAHLNLFHRSINNAILNVISQQPQTSGNPLTVVEPQNSAVAGVQQGALLDLGQPLSQSVRVNLGLGIYRSYLRANGERNGQRLPNQPAYSLSLSLDRTTGSWQWGGQWRYQGRSEEPYSNFDRPDDRQTSYLGHALDLYLSYQQPGWQAGLTARQLLNDDREIRTAETRVRFHAEPVWQLSVSGRY